MKHFVVVYDRQQGMALDFTEYGDRSAAYSHLTTQERRYRNERNIEVVLLTSDSEESLRRTHGRFFKRSSELLAG